MGKSLLASTELSCHWLALCNSGSQLPQLKNTWRHWKPGASKDSLRQTLLASVHLSTIVSLLWVSGMLADQFSTFLACLLKCPVPSLFLSTLLEVKTPIWWIHMVEEAQMPEESSPSEPMPITGVKTQLYCATTSDYRAYSLLQLIVMLPWLMCSSSPSCVAMEWQSTGPSQKEIWTQERNIRCNALINLFNWMLYSKMLL